MSIDARLSLSIPRTRRHSGSAADFISTRGVKSVNHLLGMYVGLTGIAMDRENPPHN